MKTVIRNLGLAALAGVAFSNTSLFAQYGGYYPPQAALEGFPISGTSITADHELRQAGFLESLSHQELNVNNSSSQADSSNSGMSQTDVNEHGSFDITPDYGAFKSSPNLSGNTYTLPLYANFKLSDRVGLNFNAPVTYTQFRSQAGGLDVWNPDLTIGLPVKVIKKTKELPLAWTVTPYGGAGGYYADDGNSSSTYVGHGGVTSMLGYETSRFSVSMANQITCYETMSRYGMYRGTPKVNQKIVKNGLKVSVPFCECWVVDVYGIRTDFLEHSYVPGYETVGASIGYHRASMKKGAYIKIGTYTDFGSNYQSIHFQFGTGWKF